MKKIKALLAVLAFAAAAAVIMPSQQAQAASVSAAFEVISPTTDIRVEDMVKLELVLSADVEIGAVEAYISYDSDVFEYMMGPDCILGGEGVLRISDPGTSTYSTKRNYLLYFQAISMGDSKFSIRNNPEIYDANDGDAMSVSSQPLTLSVLAGTKASSDATLADLKVGSAVLSPSFDPQIKDYNVHVENSFDKLAVSAVANDQLASVKIEGADDLKVGSNRITVVVTAPDGTENKYVIYCVRDEAEAGEKTEEPAEEKAKEPETKVKEEPAGHEQAFYVTEQGSRIMLIADTEYEIMQTDEGVSVPKNFYRTSILVSGYTVTAFSPVPEGTPDYLLLILRKEGGEPGLYVYDRIEKTLQRYGLTDSADRLNAAESDKDDVDGELPDPEAYEKTISTLTTVIAVLSGVCMLLLIIVIRIIVRRRTPSPGKRERTTAKRESTSAGKRRR